MWAVESPGAGPTPSSHRTEPALTAPPDSLRRDSPRAPSSLCSSPGLGSGSLPPDSLQAFPGLGSPLESPSIQCDSLECPCCCCGSAGSGSGCADSLQAPLALGNGRRCFGAHHSNPQTHSDLSDSLESFGVQHDSLQSLSSLCESFSSSSIEGDSLESLSSLSSGSTSQHSGLEFTSQLRMEVRGPRRNPSYLSDLYQNMLRAGEAPRQGQQQLPAARTSSCVALQGSSPAKGGPQPNNLQSSTSSSCDPALRPIIRRRARSLPTSPERRKRAAVQCQVPGCQSRMNRVRFADALGLDLTEVKVFQTGEDPSIPLHVLSRLSINSDLWYSSSDLEFTMQCLVPDFQQPADCMDFSSRLREQQVCLERVTSSDLGLSGTIHVCNVAFEKRVSVRYTFNQWKSLHEVCAHWHRSISEKNGQDQVDVFTFFLPVPPFLLQLCSVVQFAARYQVNGQEYWDNNKGKNYSLTCRTHPLKMPRECEESWIHFI